MSSLLDNVQTLIDHTQLLRMKVSKPVILQWTAACEIIRFMLPVLCLMPAAFCSLNFAVIQSLKAYGLHLRTIYAIVIEAGSVSQANPQALVSKSCVHAFYVTPCSKLSSATGAIRVGGV